MKSRVAMVSMLLLVAVMVTLGDEVPSEIWDTCRLVNKYLALAAFLGVTTRFGMMIGDPDRHKDERAIHVMFWFMWICISLLNSSLGAAYYNDSETPANYTSGIRTILHFVAIALAVWWPHPRQFTPSEE